MKLPPVTLVAPGLLVALTGAPRGTVAPVPPPVESLSLELRVDAASSAEQYSVAATFRFRLNAPEADVHFFVPDASGSEALRGVELNGRPVPSGAIALDTHPELGRPVFRLRVRSRPADDVHRLRVVGPRVAMKPEGMVRWGAWHPVLSRWDVPVPISLEVEADTAREVIASGIHVGTQRAGGVSRSRWRTANPQGWVFLAIGRYARRTTRRNGITLEIIHPETEAAGDTTLVARAHHVIDHLSRRFGPANGAQFRLIGFPLDRTQRFSHDGLVALSTESFSPALRSSSYAASVLAHEFAHYWWGDMVRIHGPGDGWLSEGLAEYSRHLYERATGGDSLAWGYRNLLVLSRFADGSRPPTLVDTGRRAGVEEVHYQKGAFVLHMLEDIMGPARFGAGLRELVAAGRAGPVTLHEFTSIMERSAGRSLRWFFDQWLTRPTGPLLAAAGVQVLARNGGFEVRGALRQAHPPYRLAVPLRVELDGLAVDTVLAVRDTVTPFAIPLPRRPRQLLVDPDSRLFKWFSADQLPIGFADAWSHAATGGRLRLEHDPGTVPDSVVEGFRRFLEARFGPAVTPSAPRDSLSSRALLGDAAARFRAAAVPWLPEPPAAGEVRAYIARDPAHPRSFVIGVEGDWPATWPELVPQVPWREIRYRDGRMAGASTPAPPRIAVRLDG